MDEHVNSHSAQDRSPIALLKSSPSSSFSSSSSSSSWPADYSSPVWTEPKVSHEADRSYLVANEAIQGVGLTNILVGLSGMEWKDVEKRFNQLASTGNGIEPVVKWSEFGHCIGMQQSAEFASELLRALRRGKEWKTDITKSDMCNRNVDGRITVTDIKQTILLSASTNKLSVTYEEAEDYAALIMELLDNESRGYIEITQLESLFKANQPKASSPIKQLSTATHVLQHNDHFYGELQETMSRVEVLFRTYWRRTWIILVWLLACFGLFTWKFVQYRHRSAFEIMGYCLSTAKGAAETLKLNMALILLPVCRNTMTWLRKNRRINSVIPFNDNINFHKLIAGGIVVGVILHGGTHLACDFPRISGSDRSIFRQTIAVGFGYHQPTYVQILATTEGATGIAMVVLMAIAFSLATRWPRRQSPVLPVSLRRVTGYNTFWYSHHLFILVYALLIIHSFFLFLTHKITEKTTWMYIAFPVLLYAGERIFRAVRSGFYEVDILKASLYPGKVLSLKMQKPEGFEYKSGMYVFLQCPQISPFEWHPFSLTSGPQDDYLSVHIRTLGDWSYQIYGLFQEAVMSGSNGCPKLYIDGPYGSASQDHAKYDIVVLIGLGIGATPFISILKDVVNGVDTEDNDHVRSFTHLFSVCNLKRGPAKVYFYWITREQSSFDWFRDFMKESSNSTQKQSTAEIHNYLTSVYEEGDVRSAFISVIQALHHAKKGIDIVSKTPIRTHFARPNWFNIFSRLASRHRGAKIGVFYCGPSNLARELKGLCTKFSTKTTTRFVFHKENY
ncbi:hypothetical protein L6164_011244 [Bauhinia variegata]|uniref:Uncharacterized protein n=1 Tax=Bauhinia variegata TaxID=167791 RepID=A0ACB9P5H7_BAUVA|nr:hypothetical protein L6164_011244 [Bauhinia variegata]